MRTSGLQICLTLISVTSLMMASCSGNEPDSLAGTDNSKGTPLRFAVSQPRSKAAVTTESLRQFSVWANYRAIGAGQQVPWVPVFSGNDGKPAPEATVTKDPGTGAWGYGDVQYWYPGNSYSFQAFHAATDEGATAVTPTFNTTANNASHYLTLSDFNGTEGTDLLYAVDVRDYADTNSPSVVSLNFSHLTAKVVINGVIDPVLPDGHTVTVTSVRLYGMNTRGSWSGLTFNPANGSAGVWTLSKTSSSTVSNPYAANTTARTITKSTTPTDLIRNADNSGHDIMMLPQEIPVGSRVEIKYYNNNETETIHTVNLNIWTASTQLAGGWKAGNTYRYTVTFGGSDYIIFDAPQVETWTDEGGGNIIIQKPV